VVFFIVWKKMKEKNPKKYFFLNFRQSYCKFSASSRNICFLKMVKELSLVSMGSFTHAWYIFSIVVFCLILSYPSAYTAAVLHFKNLECRTFNTSLQKWKCKCKYMACWVVEEEDWRILAGKFKRYAFIKRGTSKTTNCLITKTKFNKSNKK
jgi:hypothetical protein